MDDKTELLSNLEKIHTTPLGKERIKRNLCLDVDDVIHWCKQKIKTPKSAIHRNGKNFYIAIDKCIITVNASSYTIITAKKISHP